MKPIIGQKLVFAGILTEVNHRVSKKGAGFANFTIEDYNDSFQFALFGEDYLQFKHFLTPNAFLHMTANVQKGWVNKEGIEGEPRIKFTHFGMLQSVLDNKCKKLTILMGITEVNDQQIESLHHIISNYPGGKQSVEFKVFDPKENIHLTLVSQTTKVNVNKELLDELAMAHVQYKIA